MYSHKDIKAANYSRYLKFSVLQSLKIFQNPEAKANQKTNSAVVYFS